MRVNARFDDKLNLTSIQCYKKDVKFEISEEESCAYLLLLLVYYAEVVHATIHVFHLLMVTGIADSTQNSEVLYNFAKPYFPNVYLKHEEVELLLFGPGGALVGGQFKADRMSVLAIAREMLCLIGSFKTAEDFLHKFILKNALRLGLSHAQKAGILEEFQKQAYLISPYAKEMTEEFRKLKNGKELEDCNNNIALFYSNTGDGVSQVANITTWIELMSVTGIMHGNTLSFTRLMITQPIVAIANIDYTPNFTDYEIDFVTKSSGTIIGIIEDRSVFSDKYEYDTTKFSPELKGVIAKYAGMSADLKIDYFKKIRQHPRFNEIGWVLTDYCTDGIDAKQLTLTTYV